MFVQKGKSRVMKFYQTYGKLSEKLGNLIDRMKYYKAKVQLIKSLILNKTETDYYSDLMPKSEVSNIETYYNALDWAINKNQKVKNIALSGPYGAGKSTIIESYIKRSKIRKNKILRISLATFTEINKENINKSNSVDEEQKNKNNEEEQKNKNNEERQKNNKNDDSQKDNKNNDMWQLIEKSILEQIIYRIDGRKAPYSRFKKINKVAREKVWTILIILFICATSGWLLYNADIIHKFQNSLTNINIYNVKELLKDLWLTFAITFIFVISLIIILYYLTKSICRGLKITKVKFDKTEIEINVNGNESIFNKYLDEILYFFEETKYRIVVFEDIDRFDNLNIFTKLREINSFLNNYEKIKRRIIFLYAIRDDMFSDKERTKFFDFIIPVIPFLDAHNSRQILLNKFDDKYTDGINGPSDRLIKDITIFLDDMRLLTNIINEYIIYYKQINDSTINADKLFSIIVYKNLFPKDFYKLQYNDGIVKKVFDKKHKFIEQEIKNLEDKIGEIKKLIDSSEMILAKSVEDLHAIFSNRWSKQGIRGFYFGNGYNEISINDIIYNRKYEFNENSLVKMIMTNGNVKDFAYDDLFTAFGAYDNYFSMADAVQLKNKDNLNKKEEEMEECLHIINELKLITLKNFIMDYGHTDEIFEEIKNEELLVFLLREGHIDERYRDYISYFYPGVITQNDMFFLRCVKNCSSIGYDYTLNNIAEIIEDISADELKSESVLNNDFINYLLENFPNEKGKFDIILNELIKNIELTMEFIDQFYEKSINRNEFINNISKVYTGFWDYIMNKSKLSNRKIDSYFTCIIDACDEDTIIAMNENGYIKKYIENSKSIFQMKYTTDVEVKLEKIISEFNIKFSLLDESKVKYCKDNEKELEYKLIMYILNNNMFLINENMIRYFYEFIVGIDKEKMILFESKNYSSIKMHGNDSLRNCIENNLNEYIINVFLKLFKNTDEDVVVIEEFLNSNKITEDNIKIQIINKAKITIKDLNKVPVNLWNEIIDCNKWDITWFNIICYFECFNQLNYKIIEQLNKVEVYKELSIIKINKIEQIKEIGNDVCDRFYQYLYESADLTNNCLNKIQASIPKNYIYTKDSELSYKRIKLILEYNRLDFSVYSFLNLRKDYIKLEYDESHYNWVVNNFNKLLENTKDIPLEIKDIKIYLNENKINLENRIRLINCYKEFVLKNLDDSELKNLIFSLNDYSEAEGIINQLDNSIFEVLINNDFYFSNKVCLLANKIQDLNLEDIKKYLNILGQPLNLIFQKNLEKTNHLNIEKSFSINCLLEKLVNYKYIDSFHETSTGYNIEFKEEETV